MNPDDLLTVHVPGLAAFAEEFSDLDTRKILDKALSAFARDIIDRYRLATTAFGILADRYGPDAAYDAGLFFEALAPGQLYARPTWIEAER